MKKPELYKGTSPVILYSITPGREISQSFLKPAKGIVMPIPGSVYFFCDWPAYLRNLLMKCIWSINPLNLPRALVKRGPDYSVISTTIISGFFIVMGDAGPHMTQHLATLDSTVSYPDGKGRKQYRLIPPSSSGKIQVPALRI